MKSVYFLLDACMHAWSDPEVSPSTNVWDDGYPSGGKYWSDYEATYPLVVNKYHGANQNVPGSDGIWDSSYEIDVDNRDNYPLADPWILTLAGDVDGDGDGDIFDLSAVGLSFGYFCCEPAYSRDADINLDGIVDTRDISILSGNWGKSKP